MKKKIFIIVAMAVFAIFMLSSCKGDLAEIHYTYDENGNLIEERNISNKNKNIDGFQYSYDEDGKLVKKTLNKYSTVKDDVYRYFYDEDGKIIKEERYEYDTSFSHSYFKRTYEYFYDENDRLISIKGPFIEYEKYFYDDNGLLIKKVRNITVADIETYEYFYDENARLIEERYKYVEINTDSKTGIETHELEAHDLTKYFYDENGVLIGKVKFSFVENKYTIFKCVYDEKGRLIKELVSYS